ncbi:MAG: TdeIII family type II restriction endonuclease [Ignavibacteriales bacterium]|nr:TdeIII family type II restriction endonuclease [Leptospiraceae bacterium]MCB9207683.1 TdeIII family type II restriction endonuclease [Ignavibacteriales bacterium]
MSQEQIKYIEDVIRNCLRDKFLSYKPESSNMPFHYRLLGKDRMVLYSFIHSLNTSFGTSIFEPVAIALSKHKFKESKKQAVAGNRISEEAHKVIQTILDSIITGKKEPDKKAEIELIRKVCQKGKFHDVKPTKIDILVLSHEDVLSYFDLKTVKPNIGNFKEYKRTLLEWVAATLSENPNAKISTAIAIPYNPYDPKPYERWTMKGILDLKHELYVAEEFWDFLGGEGSYNELLNCFERVGIELRPEIDKYFSKFK